MKISRVNKKNLVADTALLSIIVLVSLSYSNPLRTVLMILSSISLSMILTTIYKIYRENKNKGEFYEQ